MCFSVQVTITENLYQKGDEKTDSDFDIYIFNLEIYSLFGVKRF